MEVSDSNGLELFIPEEVTGYGRQYLAGFRCALQPRVEGCRCDLPALHLILVRPRSATPASAGCGSLRPESRCIPTLRE
jgi:hypothetical protein